MACNFSYSTAATDGSRSIDSWREAMAEVYYHLDVRTLDKEGLSGQLLDWQSDIVGISNFKADAQRVVRHRESVKFDADESLVFLFPTQQPLIFQQLGRQGMAFPGQAFLLTSAEPYVVDVPNGSENITVKIDRQTMLDRLPQLRDMCGTVGFANPHLIPAAITLGRQIINMEATSHETVLEQVVIDLICAMIEMRPHLRESPYLRPQLSSLLYDRLCVYVSTHYHIPNLSPHDAAAAHRISTRYLHKVFHDRGSSFGRFLMSTRLQHARSLILHAASKGRLNLGEIAFQCGFSSQAHFSTSYKALFGETPSGRAYALKK